MLCLIGSESSAVSILILGMLSQHFLLLPSNICSAYTVQPKARPSLRCLKATANLATAEAKHLHTAWLCSIKTSTELMQIGAITQQTHAIQAKLQRYMDKCVYVTLPNSPW